LPTAPSTSTEADRPAAGDGIVTAWAVLAVLLVAVGFALGSTTILRARGRGRRER
jgi:hypothetical protein